MALIPWTDRAVRRLKKLGYTRQDLADHLGLNISTVNGYFRAAQRNEPSQETIENIAHFLKVHPAWLMYNVRTKEPEDSLEDTLHSCVNIVIETAEKMGVNLSNAQAIRLAVYLYDHYDELALTNSNVESLINLVTK